MKITPLGLCGLMLIELDIHADARGFFMERFKLERFQQYGLPTEFVQDNHSRSLPCVLRGLHYQVNPAQGKLVGVIRGRIWDVAVDVRPDSETYGRSYNVELNDANGRLLWIPAGFAHGFCVLGDEAADVLYKVDNYYNPEGDKGIFWADADLSIPWPISSPFVSDKDRQLGSFAEYNAVQQCFVNSTLTPRTHAANSAV